MKPKHHHSQSILAILIVLILTILACSLPSQSGNEITISVLSPLQGATFGVGETIEVRFRAEADATITRVEMTLDGNLIATQDGGPTPFEGSFSWVASEAGSYNLILTAYDAADEASSPAGVTIIVEAEQEDEVSAVESDEPDQPEADAEQTEQLEPADQPDQADQADQAAQQPVDTSEILQPLAPFYLTDGGYFDFDHASGINGAAVIFEQPDPALPEINFWNDRISIYELGFIALWGDSLPTFEDCRAAALSGSEIPTKNLPVGTMVCFQTDQGSFGYFTVQDRYLDQYGDLVLGFDYILWDANGRELPVERALQTISGTTYPQGVKGKDLDFYRNVRLVDLTFEVVSDTRINIVPATGSQLAAWGPDIPTYPDCAALTLGTQPVPIELEQVPDIAPVKESTFLCFRTDEGRLGRLFIKWVYLGYFSAPLPYGDPWASADFRIVYEGGDGILVEYYADTWALADAVPSGLIPQRAAATPESYSGRLVIPFKSTVDFDLGTTLVDPRSIPDLEYLANEDTGQAHLAPWHDTILQASWGATAPSYEECQSANLTNTPMLLENGQFVCFQASTGRSGFYQINDFYFDADAFIDGSTEFFVDLSYTLWAVDSGMVVVHQPVHVLKYAEEWLMPGSYDLDMEMGDIMEDITFGVDSPDQVQIAPAPGVGLAYWGLTMPNYQDCVSLSLGSESLSVAVSVIQNYDIPGFKKLSIPAFFCYQTDEGRLGRLEFEGLYDNPDNGQIHLIISAESWHIAADTFSPSVSPSDTALSQSTEDDSTEFAPDEQGVIKSGEVRLPNVVAYDFVSENIETDRFDVGDLVLEYNPENLEGCFLPIAELGATILGPIPDDLSSIDVQQVAGFTGGCIPIELNYVYVFMRGQPPGVYIIFRVTAFDENGVTLEYIVGEF